MVRGDEKQGEPQDLIVTAHFPLLTHPDDASVFGPDRNGIRFYANYVFTIDNPTMRVLRVKIDTNLPPVRAMADLAAPSPAYDKYPPRAANILEYELDLSVMPRDGGRRLETMMRVRTRILHFHDDDTMSSMVRVDRYLFMPDKQLSWLRGARVTGPDGQEIEVLDQRAAEANCWNEATVEVPLKALGWIKKWYDIQKTPESRHELSLILARGTYKPIVKSWTLDNRADRGIPASAQ
jgi:hypothetical protein